jgi:hypothetical protein
MLSLPGVVTDLLVYLLTGFPYMVKSYMLNTQTILCHAVATWCSYRVTCIFTYWLSLYDFPMPLPLTETSTV